MAEARYQPGGEFHRRTLAIKHPADQAAMYVLASILADVEKRALIYLSNTENDQ